MQNPALRSGETVDGDSQEEDGMDQSDEGTLAIGQDPKVIHTGLSVAHNASMSRDLPNLDL